MEKIAVEEEHIAGIHLGVDKRETVEDRGDAFLVGAGLTSRQYVVDSSDKRSASGSKSKSEDSYNPIKKLRDNFP